MPSQQKPPSQADKFREMARELEADEDPANFERIARQIVDAPVPPKEAKPTSKKSSATG